MQLPIDLGVSCESDVIELLLSCLSSMFSSFGATLVLGLHIAFGFDATFDFTEDVA